MTRKTVISYEIDHSTGESRQLTGYNFIAQPKRRNGFTNGHFSMGTIAAHNIAEHIKRGETLRVMMSLSADVGMENHVIVNQSDTARRLGIKQANVARAIKELVAKKVLFAGPKLGRLTSYKFNPAILWRGSSDNHKKALRDERLAAIGIRVIDGGQPLEPRTDTQTIDWLDNHKT